ncbi:MAG TPA: delta-60 repeat domain-containing protein [Opitutaceae bacterium]|nr:delta-60 repeat domain-containing protein [Opitutaceae bacterium]
MYSASLFSSALRRFGLFSTFCFAIGSAALAQSNTPSAADGYDPNVDGSVFALVTQADGKLLVGGSFASLRPNGTPAGAEVGRSNLARLTADGRPDTFAPNPNGAVNAIAVQPTDGKIIIAGAFTSVGSTPRNRIARLNVDGTVDASFTPNLGNQLSDVQVYAVAIQADGRIVVGGTFTSNQATGPSTGLGHNRLVRLEANGAVDTTFNPDLNNAVFALAIEPDGQIIAAGSFTAVGSVTRNRLARFNANGSLDNGFDPNASSTVSSLLLLPDGKIYVGGSFASLQPPNVSSAVARSSLARLNADGSIDGSFAGGANGQVAAIALQPDGKVVVGGGFTTLWPASGAVATAGRNFTGRFNVDGSLDDTFNPTMNGHVRAIITHPDGSVIVGGLFTQIRAANALFSTTRNHLARINADGTSDTTLDLGAGGGVIAMAVDSTGRTLIGGTFNTVGGSTRNYLARLNANGTLDTGFSPALDGRVLAIALDADNKILVGGVFRTIAGTSRNFIARLNTDGSLDAGFNPNPSAPVNAIALQSDRKILIGGTFTSLQPNSDTTFTSRNNYARLNSDGGVDTTYTPATNGAVLSIKIQGDGKAVVAGNFQGVQASTATAPVARNGIVRFNSDGSVDAAYNPNPNNLVNAIAFQGDKIIAVGAFTVVQANGATSNTTRNRIARFNTDGTLDTGFNPDANNTVNFVSVLPNGKVLVGGTLTAIGSTAVREVALLNADGSLDANFIPRPNGRVVAAIPLSDTSILLGGTFTSLQQGASGTPVEANRLVRVNAAGTIDATFSGAVGGQPAAAQVNAVALQPDGRILVGGSFGDLGGTTGGNIARFFADGAPDTRFAPSANGAVNAIAVRPDLGTVTTQGGGFAWVKPDGTLRPGFSTDVNSKFVGRVLTVARQPNGRIILGGSFTNSSGVTGPNLARFFADGTLDPSFNHSPNGIVNSVIALDDGSVLVAGGFTSIAGVTRNRIARFKADGTLDTTFDPNALSTINAMLVQPDGKIVIGGAFTSLQPNGASAATIRTYLARLEPSGLLDGNFNPTPNSEVTALAYQPDGKIVLGGQFTALQPSGSTTGTSRVNLARVNENGTLDTGFDPNHGAVSGPVYALLVQPNGSILIGGAFSAIGGIPRSNLARIDANGGVDFNFDPSPNSQVNALALTPTGHILVGGFFSRISFTVRNRVARLDSTGAIDTTFDPNANDGVTSIVVLADQTILLGGLFTTLQPSGSVVVGGAFTNVGGAPATNLAFINDDGTATALRPNPNDTVNALLIQGDGKIVLGGKFTSVAGTARNRVARLNSDGSLESGFNPNLDGAVLATAQQADGKLLLAGQFITVGGVSRHNLARLNTDGTLDNTFAPSFLVLPVPVVAVQADGKIVAVSDLGPGGAQFSRFNADGSTDATFAPLANGAVKSVVIQADGKLLVGGSFTTIAGVARNRLARLNADGSVDASFDPNANESVSAIALQSDGKPVVGGAFSQIGGLPRVRVARLASTSAALQSIVTTGTSSPSILWVRGGTSPEVASTTFERSVDGRSWTSLGQSVRTGGTWTVNGASLGVTNGIVLVRARGIVPTVNGGSSGLVEQTMQFRVTGGVVALSASEVAVARYIMGSDVIAWPVLEDGSSVPGGGSGSGNPSNPGGPSTNPGGVGAGLVSGHLFGLSCLAHVDSSTPLITGFIVSSADAKQVLLRAVGPGLASLNVPGVLAMPRLQLHAASGEMLLENNNWGGGSTLTNIFAQVGEFPLAPDSTDSAAAVMLGAGGYTVVVTDRTGAGSGGMVLAEIYDVAGTSPLFSAMSARGHVAANGGSLTGGFAIVGDSPRRVLIRGVGPALGSRGVTDGLSDPIVAVYHFDGRSIASNNDWQTPLAGGLSAAEINSAAASVGVYAFADGSKDAAMVITLPPGTYTAQVTAGGSAKGSAVVEIYELP